MNNSHISSISQGQDSTPKPERWEDFLTPEQRAQAVAEILSTIALRILRERHENKTTSDTQA